ncbi:hypothetical protein [Aeoliella sp.]|uniref:hypothetical protein n=1 Tax=Aeoliella sp. TaxID=2795800 RepID=UPI003CCBC960
MAKRLLMVMLFVGAIGVASLVTADTAEARHRCYRGGYGHYYGGPVVTRSYYGGGFYAPRRAYYAPRVYGPGWYGPSGLYMNGYRGGIYVGW